LPNRGIFEEKIVRGVALIASGMTDAGGWDSPVLARHVVEAVRIVGERLRRDPPVRCPLCGRSPFTRKGYYLHLLRIHYHEILQEVRSEAERYSSSRKL